MLTLRSLAGSLSSRLCRLASTAHLDYSRYPTLKESDIEEDLMRGSGPGGQAVNKTNNCVFLRHLPTGITVKCHLHRLASKNRIEARKILLDKLDVHLNGEHSIAAQLKALEQKKSTERKRRQGKLQEMKKNWQNRERAESDVERDKWKYVHEFNNKKTLFIGELQLPAREVAKIACHFLLFGQWLRLDLWFLRSAGFQVLANAFSIYFQGLI